MKSAIVLCSGGLDSVVTSYYVKNKLGYGKIKILFFSYGQRTLSQERLAAKKCSARLGAEFEEVKIDFLNKISTSLINSCRRAKKVSRRQLRDSRKESKNWYVPCRNTLFIIYALITAESEFIQKKVKRDIFLGFKCEGNDSYPDTTKEFVKEVNRLSKISCIKNFRVIAPLIEKDKEDIILLGKKLGARLEDTYSCYAGRNKEHCGSCLACRLRQEGFYWANVKDKTKYAARMKDYRN